MFTVGNQLSLPSLPNAGLFHWASNRSDLLAAAGSPGIVPVVESCWGIGLCRKIPGRKKKHAYDAVKCFIFLPSQQLVWCVSSSGAPALHRHLHRAKAAGDDAPRRSQMSPWVEPAAERSNDGVWPSGGGGENYTQQFTANLLCIKTLNLSLKTVSNWLKLYCYHYCLSVHVCFCVTPQLQRCREALDLSLPPPLDSVVTWLQRAEAALTDEREVGKSHADAAKDARTQKDNLEVWSLWVLVLRYLILLS